VGQKNCQIETYRRRSIINDPNQRFNLLDISRVVTRLKSWLKIFFRIIKSRVLVIFPYENEIESKLMIKYDSLSGK
jgi:hypothetical protein